MITDPVNLDNCRHSRTTFYERDGVEVCDNCGFIVWEDLG